MAHRHTVRYPTVLLYRGSPQLVEVHFIERRSRRILSRANRLGATLFFRLVVEKEQRHPQRDHQAYGKQEAEQEEAQASPDIQEKGEELKEELDALLDEIDDVLEENAEEFVKQYVQKGGE